ncbi:MAG: hypothetical protein DWQ02_08980 [Bacteroidetes bacterium]|nr:MAG: hypothetical protein DWQ02_08980 [Bacteroidota bacterium]
MITSIIIMMIVLGYIAYQKGVDLFNGLNLVIFLLIIIFGVIALIGSIRKENEAKKGFPAEDELSTQIKYKSGYYAYMASMYLWLFIFLLKDSFPNTESMIGGGILLSALIFYISRIIVKRGLNG